MSDSDDDYMSDKLLQKCVGDEEEKTRPGLIYHPTVKRDHEQFKKKLKQKQLQPKKLHVIQADLREKGLNTPLSSENKGFKLLAKMGYKPGEGLGKANSGRIEPIKIEVKQGSSGVGREKHLFEKKKELIIKKHEDMTKKFQDFQASLRNKTLNDQLSRDFFKAQKACEELDEKNGVEDPIENFYWTKLTNKKRLEVEEEDEEEFEEYFMNLCNEENLTCLIDYLRYKYLYCMYCGFIATDVEDLEVNCPGAYRIDHDDD